MKLLTPKSGAERQASFRARDHRVRLELRISKSAKTCLDSIKNRTRLSLQAIVERAIFTSEQLQSILQERDQLQLDVTQLRVELEQLHEWRVLATNFDDLNIEQDFTHLTRDQLIQQLKQSKMHIATYQRRDVLHEEEIEKQRAQIELLKAATHD